MTNNNKATPVQQFGSKAKAMALKDDEAAQDYVPKNIFLTGGAGTCVSFTSIGNVAAPTKYLS
jgi:hypothetical protein